MIPCCFQAAPTEPPQAFPNLFLMPGMRALPTKCPHKHFACAESFGANAISKYIANRTPSDCSPLHQSRIYKTSICANRPMVPKPNPLRPRQGDGGEMGLKIKMAMRGVCANDEKSTAVLIRNLYRTKIVGQSTETKTYASAARWHRRLNEGQTKLL